MDKLTDLVKTYKAKGLAFTRLSSQGESSSYEKFLTPREVQAVRHALDAQPGDLLLIVADPKESVVLGKPGSAAGAAGQAAEPSIFCG